MKTNVPSKGVSSDAIPQHKKLAMGKPLPTVPKSKTGA